MSMQPMLTIHSSASSSFTTGASIHFFVRGDWRGRDLTRNRSIHSGMCDGASFWKNALPNGAVGIAAHRERPSAQVRQEHAGDLAVVVDQVAFRDPLVGPEDLVEVRELHALVGIDRDPRAAPPRGALSSRSPSNTGARRCPSCVHSANETSASRTGRTHTTSPFRTFGIFGTVANGASAVDERRELRQQLVDRALGEAGADVPDPRELVVLIPCRARARRSRPRAGPAPSCSRRSTNSWRSCVLIFNQSRVRLPSR